MPTPTRTIDYAGDRYTVTAAHPAADALPWDLDQPEFATLVESMRAAGFDPDRPAVRHADTGLLIDGRRRELAARVARVAVAYRDVRWDDEEVVEWVRQEHLPRRNLTPSQRAAAAVELSDLLARGANQHTPEGPSRDGPSRTAAEIAAEHGVGERTVEAAAKVKKTAPDLMPSVKEGRLSARAAEKVADLPPEERAKVVAAPDPRKAAKEAIDAAPKKAPRKKPAPAPRLTDQLGNPVPDCVADTFGDPMLADAVARIDAAHKELLSVEQHVATTLNKKADFWPYAQFGECVKSLKAAATSAANASAQLAVGLPFCVCPACRGGGCKACRDGGHWSRHRYEQRAQYGD